MFGNFRAPANFYKLLYMNRPIFRVCLSLGFVVLYQSAFAQNGLFNTDNVWSVAGIGVVMLLVLGVILQVADNLLVIEGKQTGADRSGANFSIFPSWSEITRSKLPSYVPRERTKVLDAGYDIPLKGRPTDVVSNSPSVNTYSISPKDFTPMSPIPKVLVEVGDSVKAGQPVFFDKKRPDVQYVAPVSGEVIEIERGEKRSIANIKILADKTQVFEQLELPDLNNRRALVDFMIGNGVWPLFRQRPFNVVPDVDDLPRDIFVTTFDTAPQSPNLNLAVQGEEAHFQKGLDVLNALTPGKVYLGLSANKDHTPADVYQNARNVEQRYFKGAHPAGNVGVHIHHTAPIGSGNDKVWTISVHDVLLLGRLFTTGQYDTSRVISLSGHLFAEPRHIKTRRGANVGELVKGQLVGEGGIRLVTGDLLSGHQVAPEDFLSFYDDQLTCLAEGNYYEMFGWLLPTGVKPSYSPTLPVNLFPGVEFEPDTNTHGERRAFVYTGEYERVLPMDVLVQQLMKAIMINDFENMEGLGIYEVVEEDVALCEFVCTSKQPLQTILRRGMDLVRSQG